jgi:hypothetical protein
MQDRLIHEPGHYPYKNRRKAPGAIVCPKCGVVFRMERGQWAETHMWDARKAFCQVCQPIVKHGPAGAIVMRGDFVEAHRDLESFEMNQHPLHPIMNVEKLSDAPVLNTNDIHLPRRVGEALRRAHKGELNTHRMRRKEWRRDFRTARNQGQLFPVFA